MEFKKEYNFLSKGQRQDIIKQFDLEIKYSNILRNTVNSSDRGKLYYEVYSKFFARLPDNSILHKTVDQIDDRVKRTKYFLLSNILAISV